VLTSSMLMMVAFSRAGSSLFWKPGAPAPTVVTPDSTWHPGHAASLGGLALLLIACAVFAGPLSRYTAAAADQLLARQPFIAAVLGAQPVPAAIDLRREMRQGSKDPAGAKP